MVGRSELATRLARDGVSHSQAVHAVDAVLHEITAALVAGERVALTGFGTFEPVARPERVARNPRTGAPVRVPAATVTRFRAGTALRAALLTGDAGAAPAGSLPEEGGAGTRGTAAGRGRVEPTGVDRSSAVPAGLEPGEAATSAKRQKPKKGAKQAGRAAAADVSGSKKHAAAKKGPAATKHAGGKKASAAKKTGGGKKAKTKR